MSEFIQSLSGWVVAGRSVAAAAGAMKESSLSRHSSALKRALRGRYNRAGRHCNTPPIYMSGTCSRFADLNGTVTVGNALP